MRQARFTPRVVGTLLSLAGSVLSAGCTHNYYYGAAPACAPVVGGVVTDGDYGSVCEVPSQVVGGSTVVAAVPARPTPTLTGPRPPKVVMSQPNGSRDVWRRSDPDGLAVTRVEGGRRPDAEASDSSDAPTLTR